MSDFASAADLANYQAGDADLLLAAAEAEVRSYCGWHIYPSKTETLTVNGTGRAIVPLPTLHLTDVTDVSETSREWGQVTTNTLTAGTDYLWSAAGYLTRFQRGYPWRWTTDAQGITLTISHGYTAMPLEVQSVILALASRAASSSGDGGVDMVGPFRYTPPKNTDGTSGGVVLSTVETSILDRYRIPAQP